MRTKLARLFLLSGFAACLVLPAIDMKWKLAPRYDAAEKRQRADAPTISWQHLGEFPAAFERYFSDQFGFRDWLIRRYSLAQVKTFHRSAVPKVIIGNDDWLFYAAFGDGADIGDFQGKDPLTEKALAARRQTLKDRSDALAARGIRYLFVVAPNKHSLYPDELPLSIGPRRPGNHLDQLARYLAAHPSVPFLDLRPALQAEKNQGPLYYHSDTHWNEAGAFVGFRAIMDALKLPAPTSDDFTVKHTPRAGGDLAAMLSMAPDWPEDEVAFEPRHPPTSKLKVTVIGDSFFENLRPFVVATFGGVRFFHVVRDGGFNLDKILTDPPDIVIDERVERYLMMW